MIEYATRTEGWEGWMLEYRFGAFYIYPRPRHRADR